MTGIYSGLRPLLCAVQNTKNLDHLAYDLTNHYVGREENISSRVPDFLPGRPSRGNVSNPTGA
jgi:hypothetical protein